MSVVASGELARETRKRILVVDDDLFVRKPLQAVLSEKGFDVALACDASECLEALRGELPDLIILDVMMPGRDGYDLCEALKCETRYASIPVILLSATDRQADRDRGLVAGAVEFLIKPYTPDDLIARIRRILNLGRWGT